MEHSDCSLWVRRSALERDWQSQGRKKTSTLHPTWPHLGELWVGGQEGWFKSRFNACDDPDNVTEIFLWKISGPRQFPIHPFLFIFFFPIFPIFLPIPQTEDCSDGWWGGFLGIASLSCSVLLTTLKANHSLSCTSVPQSTAALRVPIIKKHV